MRTRGVLLVAVSLMFPLQGLNAQERGPGGRGGFGGGGFGGGTDLLSLLQNNDVANELKITADEKAFVKIFVDDVRDKDQKFFSSPDLRDLPREERGKKFSEWRTKRTAEVETQLTEMIGKDRLKRLKEVNLQVAGTRMLFAPEIQKEIGLTEAQQEKLRDSMREAMERFRSNRPSGEQSDEDRAKRREEMRKESEERVMSVLTDEQKAKWKSMLGTPITFKVETPQGDRRGGDRRPGGAGGRDSRDNNRPAPPQS